MSSENTKIITNPSDDDFEIVNLVFQSKLLKSRGINTNSLSITCLDLISRGRIQVNIDDIESIKVNKNSIFKTKNIEKELEIMEKIQFTINSKQMKKLNQKNQNVLNMFKDINKSHEFNLKSMYEKVLNKDIAIKFTKQYNNYLKSVQRESKYSKDNYKNIIENGTYTLYGNNLNNEWKEFKNQLKSKQQYALINEESEKPEEILDKWIIYGKCFDIEKNVLKNIESNCPDYQSDLYNFLKIDGANLLKTIFDKALSNGKIELKGDGSVPAGNSKHFVPGF